MSRRLAGLACGFALLLAGCATFPETARLERINHEAGYRYANLADADEGDDLFVVLTFSGGGTRAAALAYGVLETLRDSRVPLGGASRNLLEEVDILSSVSGGSFTAAYYALHREAIFADDGPFLRDFLYADLEGRLKRRLLNPYHLARLASPTFGRIDLADEVYQATLFGDATFADLPRRKPFLLLNATDMTKGSSFAFIQAQFDPLCADLDGVTISRAVAASSNFPIAFTPLALNAYPGQCDYREPVWVERGLRDLASNPRRYYRARSLRRYQEPDREYVHLLDGGVADNLGLRLPLTALRSTDPPWSLLTRLDLEAIDKLVIIVVDAKPGRDPGYDASPRAPGLGAVVNQISSVPMANYSFDSIELLRQALRTRADAQHLSARQEDPDDTLHAAELYRIYVGFDQLADAETRDYFLNLPTSFHLPGDDVDALRRAGRALLEGAPCFQSLLSGEYDEQACVHGLPSEGVAFP